MKTSKLARITGAIMIPAALISGGCGNTVTHVVKGTALAVEGIAKDTLNGAKYVVEHIQTDEEAKNNPDYTPRK